MSNQLPHNSDARQPEDIDQWPLSIIVDLSYASAILREWGQEAFIEYAQANSKDSYYRGGMEEEEDDEDASGGQTAQVSRQPTGQTVRESQKARDERHDRRSRNKQAVDPVDLRTREDMMDVVFSLWTRAAREATSEGTPPQREGPHVRDVADNGDGVRAWLQSIEE